MALPACRSKLMPIIYQSIGMLNPAGEEEPHSWSPPLNRYFVAVPQHESQNASIVEIEAVRVPAFKPAAAEDLLLATLSAHAYVRKMGLHPIPPGENESVIIANGNASRIGMRSAVLQREDADVRHIGSVGIFLTETPYTSAKNQQEAVRLAEGLRKGVSLEIPNSEVLFQ
jgi:hypothetical protein